jgi:coproporphyrinogen III oxidase-like Fe-S oxidoreductase
MAAHELVDEQAVARLERQQFLVRDGNRLRVTAKGSLLLDAILPEIVTVAA